MRKINLLKHVLFGFKLKSLYEVRPDWPALTVLTALHDPLRLLVEFAAEIHGQPMPKTRAATWELNAHLTKVSGYLDEAIMSGSMTSINVLDAHQCQVLADALLSEFERESDRVSVFGITKQGIYDTIDLLESAENKFPANLLKIMPMAVIDDLKEAGKCLAFDRPTACAFHVCRATEGLMLKYYEVLASKPWNFKTRGWQNYVDQLAKLKAPKQITNRLNEIRSDRNSYAHPDVTVPIDEMLPVYDLCTGVMFYMAKEIETLEAAKVAASNL